MIYIRFELFQYIWNTYILEAFLTGNLSHLQHEDQHLLLQRNFQKHLPELKH